MADLALKEASPRTDAAAPLTLFEQPIGVKLVGNDTLDLWEEIAARGLAPYIAELDVKGYTVVPPEIAGTTEIYPRLLEKILDVAERRHGVRPDMSGQRPNTHGGAGSVISYLLFEDEVFREYLLHPACMTFVSYLLGAHARLSSVQAQLKAAGTLDLPLHCDNVVASSPFPPHPQLCNISINLTEYAPIEGPICFVPGSHKFYRHPLPGEAVEQRVGITAAPGSLIVFSGYTWHAAFARSAPGLRASMLMQFTRPHVCTFEPYREDVSQEMLDLYPPRFGTLMGKGTNYGWRHEGPQNEDRAYKMGAHAYD